MYFQKKSRHITGGKLVSVECEGSMFEGVTTFMRSTLKRNWLVIKSIPKIKAKTLWGSKQLSEWFASMLLQLHLTIIHLMSLYLICYATNLLHPFKIRVENIYPIQEDKVLLNLHLIDFMPVGGDNVLWIYIMTIKKSLKSPHTNLKSIAWWWNQEKLVILSYNIWLNNFKCYWNNHSSYFLNK